ncbi:hypothetical protein RJT34_04501 [Clitoria ternatea]|uniref:Uncharacterized protein n=1 Tax=Clitoria ternatea TaxID=43366 RepID=A0AAN9Q2A9_CLITE
MYVQYLPMELEVVNFFGPSEGVGNITRKRELGVNQGVYHRQIQRKRSMIKTCPEFKLLRAFYGKHVVEVLDTLVIDVPNVDVPDTLVVEVHDISVRNVQVLNVEVPSTPIVDQAVKLPNVKVVVGPTHDASVSMPSVGEVGEDNVEGYMFDGLKDDAFDSIPEFEEN